MKNLYIPSLKDKGIKVRRFLHVNRYDTKSRKESAAKMERIIKSGSSILMYPEDAWNITESMPVKDHIY